MVEDDLKFKGLVREIGLIRDNDHFHSFNITVGIVIRSDKRLTYDEAERLSDQFRKRYLGKEVDLLGVVRALAKANKKKAEKPQKKVKDRTEARIKPSNRSKKVITRQKKNKTANKSSSSPGLSKKIVKPLSELKGASQTRLK